MREDQGTQQDVLVVGLMLIRANGGPERKKRTFPKWSKAPDRSCALKSRELNIGTIVPAAGASSETGTVM